jgi:hypothetical protein
VTLLNTCATNIGSKPCPAALVIKLCFQSSNVAPAGKGADGAGAGAALADEEEDELADAAGDGAGGVTGDVSGCGVAVLHAVRMANRLM